MEDIKSKHGNLKSLIALLVIQSADRDNDGYCCAIDIPLNNVLNCCRVINVSLNGPAVGEHIAQRSFNLHGRKIQRRKNYDNIELKIMIT